LLLLLLTVSGFGLAMYSSYKEDAGKETANAEAKDARANLARANKQLEDLQSALALVRVTVGDLGKLNELSGGTKYYVRVAADTSRARLEPYLRILEGAFKGSKSSGMVTIREPKTGSKNYELVFGQGLDMAAAEVFHRLATSHRLPPPGDIAYILPEPSTK
ncbi:MAG: hypothetical protein WAT12_06465, partial [Candidatus Nitrotoga sp.]